MKRIITLFLIVAVSSLTYAQEEAIVSVFQKDKTVVSVAREEVDSISYSRIDDKGIQNESIVSQFIHTKDSVHRWMLSEVDSIKFEWLPNEETTAPLVPNPRVWTKNASDITRKSAVLHGKLRGVNPSAVSRLGFYVSQDYHEGRFGGTYYEASIDNSRWGTFSLSVSGLVAAEKYYFRAAAVYKGQDFQGLVNSFRTDGVAVKTLPADVKTPFSAMVYGNMDINEAEDVSVGFFYNTTGNPNADNAQSISAEKNGKAFEQLIPDLKPGVVYYIRAYVILDEKTFLGNVIRVTTPEFEITTLEAEAGSFTAKLKGCYLPDTIEVDSVGFYYFTSSAIEAFPDFTNATSVNCTMVRPAFEYQLTGLEPIVGRGVHPDGYYYVRAYADKNGERYVSTDFVRFSTKGIKLLTMSDTIIGGKPWFRGAIFYEGELDDADRRGGFAYRIISDGETSEWKYALAFLSQLGNGDTFGVSLEALTPGCAVDYMTIYYSVTNNNLAYGDMYSFTHSDESNICPDDNHPHIVDLGLPSGTKWCCCNVGACSPEHYGDYFAWGETETKDYFDWSTYAYGTSLFNCMNIGSNISGSSYDAAFVNMGEPWQMPTIGQYKELMTNCSYVWTQYNGANGMLVTGTNGNQIFLPAAGEKYENDPSYEGSYGHYWSGNLDGGGYAKNMSIYSGGWNTGFCHRDDGQSIRAVLSGVHP